MGISIPGLIPDVEIGSKVTKYPTLTGRETCSSCGHCLKAPSPYATYYRCNHCDGWVKHEDAQKDKMGRPLCPECRNLLKTFKWKSQAEAKKRYRAKET